VFSLSRT